MKLKIAIAVAALCWPLLATAAPVFLASTVPACCRRGGEHHCMAKAATAPGEATVSGVCPHLRRARAMAATAFAGAKLQLDTIGSVTMLAAAVRTQPMANETYELLSSRAPPRA